jgi:DNA repair exonuclease SbcCD ATPase subunit
LPGWVKHCMAKFVGTGVVLFILAIGFIVVTQTQDLAALFEAFRAEPPVQKLAWFVAVVILLALIPTALWLSEALLRQCQAIGALELRLSGVRAGVKELARAQADAEASVQELVRSDPLDTVGAVTQRLSEAERMTQIQENRNGIGDLQSRVDELHARQQGLRERLLPVLEKRRAIERFFAELDSQENDIDRALTEIASGDDATTIEVRLENLLEFVQRSHERCDEVEQASKTIASLKGNFTELRARLAPYVAARDGVTRRAKDLDEARDRLTADIDALQRTPQGSLADRVQAFADDKSKLEDGLANLQLQFSRLVTLRQDVEGVAGNLGRAFDVLAVPGGDADARVAAVAEFVKATQGQFDEIERTMTTFSQLKAKLGDLQTRLSPLEAKDGGIADLIAQVGDMRDRLIAKIKVIEADDNGDLAARVNSFIEAKQQLEKRVSNVTEQFSQLATIRSDIAGLFDKLSNAADTN